MCVRAIAFVAGSVRVCVRAIAFVAGCVCARQAAVREGVECGSVCVHAAVALIVCAIVEL